VDWRLALRSWPWLVILLVAAAALYWFQPTLFQFVKA
jgi:hypothetical protein